MNEPLAPWRIGVPLLAVLGALGLSACRPLPFLRIVVGCMLAVVGYAMLQDQVSVRLSPEYFTLAHPPIRGVNDATLLGLCWGFLGAWWGGLALGVLVACAARLGRWPRLELFDLRVPLAVFLVALAVGTVMAGASGFFSAQLTRLHLGDPWATVIPARRQLSFFLVACGHFGTYSTAMVGAIVLCLWVLRQRRQRWKHCP